MTDLQAIYASQKSFYGKAKVIIVGNRTYLKSFDTIVGYIEDGIFHRTWKHFSTTTHRHVVEFCMQNRVDCGNKNWWLSLPVEEIKESEVL